MSDASGPESSVGSDSPASPDPSQLDTVRHELRRMGYLSHGVERYLLQDAVRPIQWRGVVLRIAAKLGGLGGLAMTLLSILLLIHWNPSLRQDPLDWVPLFLHLLPLWILVFGGFFLLLAGVLGTTLRRYPGLRISHLSLNLAVVGVVFALVAAFWMGSRSDVDISRWPGWLIALSSALAAYAITRLLYSGLLALAIRLTQRTPIEPAGHRQWIVMLLAAVTAAVVVVPASLYSGADPETPSVLPRGPGGRVLLLGLDGILAAEFDYLLARGEMAAFEGLVEDGGVVASYRRPQVDPAALWTSVATGLQSPDHGVAAVDSFRPLGLRTALGVNGPFRFYWEHLERPLGLAEHRPVLANRRTADTFWELTARGGEPILAVNWWSTYPAQEVAGTVVAHGAYQLLAEGTAGAVAPAAAADRLTKWRNVGEPASVDVVRSAFSAPGGAATEGMVEELLDRALWPEEFYRSAFLSELTPAVRAAALYLPAVDLAAADWQGGEVPFADLVRAEVAAADRLLAAALQVGEWDTVAIVADPGRRAGPMSGRVVLWRRSGCRAEGESTITSEVLITPEALAAGLLRALGFPQSRELPEPPASCDWSLPTLTIESYGRRSETAIDGGAGEEYMESLRALGYL